MNLENKKYVNRIYISLLAVAFFDLLGLIFTILDSFNLFFPSPIIGIERTGLLIGITFSMILFSLCALGIKRHNKWAYYTTWALLVVILFKLKVVGLVLAIFMVVWLIKLKCYFVGGKKCGII